MADCTYPKCQQTAIPGCQGLCRDLSVNRRATDGQRAGVPVGWRIVRKDNGTFIIHSPSGDCACVFHDDESPLGEVFRQLCQSMLAAAPTPPECQHVWGTRSDNANVVPTEAICLKCGTAPTPPAGDAGQEKGPMRFRSTVDLLDAPSLHTQVYVAATVLRGWPHEAAWDAANSAEKDYGHDACRDVGSLDSVLAEVLRTDEDAAIAASEGEKG